MSVPQSRQGTRRDNDNISYGEGISSKPATNHDYEELPMEEIDTSGKAEQQRKSSLKTKTGGNNLPATSASSANVGMDELKEGAYDEGESHNSFLEALNAWRNAGKPLEERERATPSSSKKVKFTEVQKSWAYQKDQSKKGSFFAALGESKDFSLGNIPTW